mgnify:CR=1 FL=1|jgi:hypothetical protein
MNSEEREFVDDVKDAIDDWDFSEEHYHEDGDFNVEIVFDQDDWSNNYDEIWDALSDVCDEWGANMDNDCNTYYLAL